MTLSLESILLLVTLSFRLLTRQRDINGVEFMLTFLLPVLFCAVFVGTDFWNRRSIFRPILRSMLLSALVFFGVVIPLFINVGERAAGGQVNIHDGALQTEIAIKLLKSGKNPYRVDYRGTPLEEWSDGRLQIITGEIIENPALDYFVYPPLYLGLSWAFSFPMEVLFGFYDQRMFLLVVFLFFVAGVLFMVRPPDRLNASILLFLNPFFVDMVPYGFNDIAPLALLAFMIIAGAKGHWAWASFFFALVLGAKHLFVPLAPMLAVFVMMRAREFCENWREALRAAMRMTWPFFPTLLFLFLPAAVITGRPFFDALFAYPLGFVAHPYPMNGFGFSQMLAILSFVNPIGSFPFWIIQIGAIIPVTALFIRRQWRNNTFPNALLHATCFFTAFFFFSRAFNVNYIGAAITLFLFVFFLERREDDGRTLACDTFV